MKRIGNFFLIAVLAIIFIISSNALAEISSQSKAGSDAAVYFNYAPISNTGAFKRPHMDGRGLQMLPEAAWANAPLKDSGFVLYYDKTLANTIANLDLDEISTGFRLFKKEDIFPIKSYDQDDGKIEWVNYLPNGDYDEDWGGKVIRGKDFGVYERPIIDAFKKLKAKCKTSRFAIFVRWTPRAINAGLAYGPGGQYGEAIGSNDKKMFALAASAIIGKSKTYTELPIDVYIRTYNDEHPDDKTHRLAKTGPYMTDNNDITVASIAPEIMLIGQPIMYATNMSEVEGQDDLLTQYTDWLKTNLSQIKTNGDYIFARGSTDIRGGEILNLKLGKKRAYSGADFIIKAGELAGFTAKDFEGVLFRVYSSYDEPFHNKNWKVEENWKERRCDFFVASQKTGKPQKIASLLDDIEKGGK